MDNKPNNQNNRNNAHRPARRPARALKAVPAKPPRKEQTRPEEKEYSFATSGLFNNALKERSVDPTAVSEAKKLAPKEPTPSTGTKVIPRTPQGRPRRPENRGKGSGSGARTDMAKQGKPLDSRTARGMSAGKGQPRRPADGAERPVRPRRPEVNSTTRVGPAVPADKRPAQSTPLSGLTKTFSTMNSVTKSIIYICCVMLFSIILSWVIITNANDVFAFVKEEKSVSLTVEPGTDLSELAEILKEEGIIKHKNTFKFFIKFRHKDSDAYPAGTYTVKSTMSYDQIIAAVTPRKQREMIRITVPEGFTVDEIIDLFVEKGMGERDTFIDVIQNSDFSDYWFIAEQKANTNRYYRLEGYLFPDTYYFYTDMTEDTIIRKFLDNFESKFIEEYRTALSDTHNPLTGKPYTVDEIVTLGSIVQAEGKERTVTLEDDEGNTTAYVDYGLISGVFHNRMNLKTPMRLQSDATTQFALEMEGKADAKLSDYTNREYTNPYNTYYCNGLPPGAVCNPGLNAISFALEPDHCPYYYFVSDESGRTYFAKTVDEHNENVNKLK